MIHKRDEFNSRLVRILPKESKLVKSDLIAAIEATAPVTYEQVVARAIQQLENYADEERTNVVGFTKLLDQLSQSVDKAIELRQAAIVRATKTIKAIQGTVFESERPLIKAINELQKTIIDAQRNDARALTADIDFWRNRVERLHRAAFEHRAHKLRVRAMNN
ncbi:hypothetical protein ESZ50_01740 [Weissella muntiaci]|uniref:Uncharacterized protein n=1 Tax=Weissella muntiaci TaxID=2508881 RepID=A0A6C2C9R9_9LACO|nr:hypothetical protein [Weissella muntiaci]TYC50684.1 hypothetical protein ESZ50_01740 [Weissella muntiaci]